MTAEIPEGDKTRMMCTSKFPKFFHQVYNELGYILYTRIIIYNTPGFDVPDALRRDKYAIIIKTPRL